MDISLQNTAIEWVTGIASHKKCTHGPDKGLQWPDLGPLPDGIRQGCFFRSQKGHQDIIHIAAVIDDKYDGGFGINRCELVIIDQTDTNAIKEPRNFFCQPIANPKIKIGIK